MEMDAQNPEAGERGREFSLIGGPLHRLGCRLRLVRGGTNPIPLGLVLGWGAWSVLLALALIDGLGHRLFSLSLLGVHVRLLVVVPLFFACEAWLDPRTGTFVSMIVRSGVIPENALPDLRAEVARTKRLKDSGSAEALCLFAAVVLSLLAPQMQLPGATRTPGRAFLEMTMTAYWYWIVCLTLFRFLIFRWLWRLGLWWYFLWRLAKMELHLVPTHPDGAAGLGYLEVVHTYFIPLVLAFSAVESASLAEQIAAGAIGFEAIYPTLAVILAIDVALFLGPLLFFTPKLWACWAKGLSDYMTFAAQYVRGFEKKWLDADGTNAEPLLGTPDLQSLADLSNSVNIVTNMRRVPASLRLLAEFLLAALLPLVPLLLLEYPIAELTQKLFARLFGL